MSLAARISERTIVVALGGALLVAGCGTSSESRPETGASFYMKEAYDRLDAHFAGCTRQYGYDPKTTQSLGPYQVPPNELRWRACAYEGVRSIILPATKQPELYTALLEKDRAMTQQVAARHMTRAERRRQLDASIARIEEQERAEALRARPSAAASQARDQILARQAMSAITPVMRSFR